MGSQRREFLSGDLQELPGLASPEVIDSVHNGIVAVDGTGRITIFNRAAEKLTGVRKEDALGKPVEDVFPATGLLKVLATGEPQYNQKQVLGQTTLVVNRTPIIMDGAVVGAVAVFQDTYDLEAISAELSMVKDLNRELEAIFDSTYDEIFVTDGNGVTLRVNAACERLYGLKASDLIGKNVRELEAQGIFSPSITLIVLKERQRVTMMQTTKTGRKLIVTATPVLDEKGDIVRIVSNSRDVTELTNLHQQLEAVELQVQRYYHELSELRKEHTRVEGIVAQSPEMERVLQLVRKVAAVDSTVLILGESGVGKNAIARVLHQLGKRKDGPFIEINCGAIPETLLESELFGYEGGAFTGARKTGKPGLIEVADKGTLFLNEVGELPPALQVKLLQVIQERRVVRVGGTRPLDVDIRIIAATNRDLEQMVADGRFRQDLYYRLNVVPIVIPPLRDRPEDIPPLVLHYMDRFNRKYGGNKRLSPKTLEVLTVYYWPGNVRELENVIERLYVTVDGPVIEVDSLPQAIKAGLAASLRGPGVSLKKALEKLEQELILNSFRKHRNTYKVAAELGISQPSAARKIKKYCLKAGTDSKANNAIQH